MDQFTEAQQTWDIIANSFDNTRKQPWQFCADYIQQLDAQASVGDFGCGNGRHTMLCAAHCRRVIGIDFSRKMLKIAQGYLTNTHYDNVSFFQGNLVDIPLKNHSLDAVMYIASLHNIKKRSYRQKSLREVHRILKSKSTALISVWTQEQDRFRNYISQQISSNAEDYGDITVWWRQDGLNVPRFYHLYNKQEFLEDLQSAQLIVDSIESLTLVSQKHPDNYVALVHKR